MFDFLGQTIVLLNGTEFFPPGTDQTLQWISNKWKTWHMSIYWLPNLDVFIESNKDKMAWMGSISVPTLINQLGMSFWIDSPYWSPGEQIVEITHQITAAYFHRTWSFVC